MTKRILALALIIACIMCFCGCKDEETNPQNNTETQSNTQKTDATSAPDSTQSGVHNSTQSGTQPNTPQGTQSTAVQTENSTGVPVEEVLETKVMVDGFAPVCQYPELPTGCEMTALTMVINFYGVSADKCDISDNYLEKGEVGTVDFRKAFVGDPRDGGSYGCYAPVVVNTANKYLQTVGAGYTAVDITGSKFDALCGYIDKGTPVIVWATQDMREGRKSVTWNVEGKDLTWITPEHCMVLVGYSDNFVYIADPMYGDIRSYGKNTFINRYATLLSQAVIIQ